MADEVFRFLTVRPVQRSRVPDGGTVRLYGRAAEGSPLHRQLTEARQAGDRRRMLELADRFNESAEFVASLDGLSSPLAKLDEWLAGAHPPIEVADVALRIQEIFGVPAKQLVPQDRYQDDRRRLGDSLLAANVSLKPRTSAHAWLLRGARLCALIERIAAADPALAKKGSVDAVLRAVVLLPPQLLPPPPSPPPAKDDAAGDERKRTEARQEIRRRVRVLRDLERAIEEIRVAHDADSFGRTVLQRVEPPPERPRRSDPVPPARRGDRLITGHARRDHPSLLSEAGTATLSDATKRILHDLEIPTGAIDVPKAVARMEKELAAIAEDTFLPQTQSKAITIGDVYLADAPFAVKEVSLGTSVVDLSLPPLIASISAVSGPAAGPAPPSVPSGAGSVRPAGIADLLLVRQNLRKYEMYEVAHIENVLQGESKERTHRRTQTSEEVLVTETERTEATERDLQSSERFELKSESAETIKEDTKVDAGVTVTANYGPSVKVTAEAGFAYERAREEAAKIATSYARDVTERAVSRLQERTLERRTRRIVQEVEEINKHGVDNKGANAHIIGIYRWVDKIYEAQIVNYGRRMLLEFSVPEPAAFYRYTQSARPVEGVTLERPEPPGYFAGGTFVPLSPSAITAWQYLFWVGKYNVEGVEPPPRLYSVIGTTLEKPYSDAKPFTKVSTELKVPVGYVARSAAATFLCAAKDDYFFGVIVGDRFLVLNLGQLSAFLEDEDSFVPLALQTSNVSSIVVNVEVECRRTDEAYRRWQIKTFNSIMIAYNQLRARYDDHVAAARIQEGVAIRGRNPLANRQIERTELKKAAISLLTGQHFDLFNAMRANAPPFEYPQMDLAKAHEEGAYIQFFEQSLEWKNMMYVFYPYFWGRKEEWPIISQLDDVDPLFLHFLQAGAARVQVPVRPGFEEAVLYFLESDGSIWNGGDPPHIDDELYVSLVQEIREQTGAEFLRGEGTVDVMHDSTTVIGHDTDFTTEDVDREIRLGGVDHRIRSVNSATEVALWRPYRGEDGAGIPYSLGPKLVGEPWDVRLPTTLVMLQGQAALPDWSDAW